MYEPYRWWEDRNRKPEIVNKSGMAAIFDTNLKTIDDWIRKGMPVLSKGTNGVSYSIDLTAALEWYFAHHAGCSIAEYRRWREEDDRKLYEEFAPIEKLRAENTKLRKELAALKRRKAARERLP